jgi:hypothetical protein
LSINTTGVLTFDFQAQFGTASCFDNMTVNVFALKLRG